MARRSRQAVRFGAAGACLSVLGFWMAGFGCWPLPVLAQSGGAQTLPPAESGIWPNRESRANSDAWLSANHERVRTMRPRLLVIHFANGFRAEQARAKVDKLIAALRESSRYHGFADPRAVPALEYQVARFVDLTDKSPPADRLDGNSSRYPRTPNWREGMINFDYSRLYGEEFGRAYGFVDAQNPGRFLNLKALVDQGMVNEVWFIAYQGKYGAPFESVEVKQRYDSMDRKLPGEWAHAGNGSAEGQPFIGRSLRILFINAERGVGCAMESLGHSLERMARCSALPSLKPYFTEYAGFDLDRRYGLPFDSLYARDGAEMSYPNPTTLSFTWQGMERRVEGYVPAGNNVHFLPNGRRDYDLDNAQPVMSTIEHYRLKDGPQGRDRAELWTPAVLDRYRQLADDCMGRWMVYWRQNMPGWQSPCKDDRHKPMRSWWPYLFY